jgi:hypothetical protein
MTTSTQRMRRLRARRRGLPDPDAPQPCSECGRPMRARRWGTPLCLKCWRASPLGRLANRERMARARLAQRFAKGETIPASISTAR